jgi:hypothetical protein
LFPHYLRILNRHLFNNPSKDIIVLQGLLQKIAFILRPNSVGLYRPHTVRARIHMVLMVLIMGLLYIIKDKVHAMQNGERSQVKSLGRSGKMQGKS